jgi:hypothetical protein
VREASWVWRPTGRFFFFLLLFAFIVVTAALLGGHSFLPLSLLLVDS